MRGLFCRKAVKSRSLIAGYSLQVLVQLPILGEHLSNSMHGKKIIFCYPINHVHQPHLSLLTLCGKRFKQSQTMRSGRFESNLLTWPGRPNTHVSEHRRVVPKQPFTFLSGLWIGSISPTTGHQPRPCSRSVAQHKHKQNLSLRESERYIHSPVRSATRLTAS